MQTEVDRIDALIRAYNEALERAREVWLREELSSAAYQRLLSLRGPINLGVPAFTDDAQRQRAAEQQQRIFARLGQAPPTAPPAPPAVDAAECFVCTTLGGGVDVAAYQREGKWRVSKLLALSSGNLTPDERRQFQMPAPTSHHGVKLAAVVVSFILARKFSASLIEHVRPPLPSGPTQPKKPPRKVTPPGGRGDQSKFFTSIEEIVSYELGIPRNTQGTRIRGSGPGGYRVPDLKYWGFDGSLRRRGTIVEIKYVKDGKFGSLPGRARDQIRDAVAYVERLRGKASLVRSEADKRLLREACVEVLSNAAPPTRGEFADLIVLKLLKWEPLPEPSAKSLVPHRAGATPKSIGKPGLGTTQSVALGILISLVEASVADSLYRDSAHALDDLLRQMPTMRKPTQRVGPRLNGGLKKSPI